MKQQYEVVLGTDKGAKNIHPSGQTCCKGQLTAGVGSVSNDEEKELEREKTGRCKSLAAAHATLCEVTRYHLSFRCYIQQQKGDRAAIDRGILTLAKGENV